MPFSTSNSNDRIPSLNYKKLSITAVLLCIILFACLELSFRKAGYTPTINENKVAWSQRRAYLDLPIDHSKTIAVVGSSRSRTNIVYPELKDKFNEHHVKMLGIAGSFPFINLFDIAENSSSFNGTIILFLLPDMVYDIHNQGKKEYTSYYHNIQNNIFKYERNFNNDIKYSLQSRFACTFVPVYELTQSYKHKTFVPRIKESHVEGWDKHSFYQWPEEVKQQHYAKYPKARKFNVDQDRWNTNLGLLADAIRTIQNRNGKVILVHPPISGDLWKRSCLNFPKRKYWKDIIDKCKPACSVHFMDIPEMRKFQCPDWSHLKPEDAVTFTRILSQEISNFIPNNKQ